jgi:hypothetical protein
MKATFSLFFFFFVVTPLASAQTVSIGDYSTSVDTEFTVPITISDAELIAGGVANISFNPSIISIENVVAGDFGTPVANINNINGWVKLVAAKIDKVNKSEAVLANLIVKGFLPGQTNVSITYASLNNETGGLIKPAIHNGSITITKNLEEHPYVHLKSLSTLKTVDNINSSYSIGIFNGQNKEDTFDLAVLNHNLSAVAAINQSSITIPAWESRELTLNVTDETPGDYYVSVRAISQSNASVTDEVIAKTLVQESFSINMTSLEGTVTSIGANITYLLTIQNNQKNRDTLTLNFDGIDPSWISFDTVHELNAGEQKEIPIKITIPGTASAGSFTLTISATSSNVGTVRSASIPLIIQNGPVLSGLIPADNSHLGSDDVVFSWTTNMNSTTKVILNQSGIETLYTGDDGIYHTVIVENLTRNSWYTYKVVSNTSHGSSESEERSFYIDNGVAFTKRSYDFNIERDYDQRVTVTVKNTDSVAHEILLTLNSTSPDLIVGFVGEGSIDEIITLAPGETRDVTLALHAQDAMQKDYYLLLDLNTNESISDHAVANIHVRQPNIDLRLEEISIDPLTLAKTFRLRNYGDTVTDLNIYESGGLKGNVTFQPIVTHGYMGNGGSVAFEVAPVLSLDFTGMEGNIVVEAAGVKKSFPVNFTLPDGMGVYYGSVPNVTIEFSDYFDNDNSPNTNPHEGELVESYLTNGSLIFFSQIIVDVFQDGEPVSNANVTLKAWNSNGKTIILNGASDLGGKAFFAVYGKADDYSYKAIVEDYKVETETRNFSVDTHPLYELSTGKINWVNVSDSNTTANNFNETITLNTSPYIFRATKDIIGVNDTFVLNLRWDLDSQKQVLISGSTENNNIVFNTSGIPVGNYTATIISQNGSRIEYSETINISANDIYSIYKQKNYTFWVPFPVNNTYMATLNIDHKVLSEDRKLTLDLNDVGTNNHNKSEYLFKYVIISNETKNETVNLDIVTPRGTLYQYVSQVYLEADVPSFINITIPVNYSEGDRIEQFNISATVAEAKIQINVTPKMNYIYEKRIWVGSDTGVVSPHGVTFKQFTGVLISCGSSFAWDLVKQATGAKYGDYAKELILTWNFAFENPAKMIVEIADNNLEGAWEGAGSSGIETAELTAKVLAQKGLEKKLEKLGAIWSAAWCLKQWVDVGAEAGVFEDMRDIGIYVKYYFWNWYCTNRPSIWSHFILSGFIEPFMSPYPNIENGYLIEQFKLMKSIQGYRPHNVNILLNDINIGSLENMIPDGLYIFRFDPFTLNYADKGTSINTINLKTRHLNGGHYAVATNMEVILPMKKMGMYVIAGDQTEANGIIEKMSDAIRNTADLRIYPEEIKFSNTNPVDDANIWINTTVFNLGTNGALFAQLQFLDNGVPISENVTVGFIPSMDSIPVNITWNPKSGSHAITVRVNPDRRIQESDYTNNEASKTITVGISPDNTPPQSITNLSLQSAGPTWLNFTWLNPPDPDFSHVMLYLNGTFITNVSSPRNYYNVTGLVPDTFYELGTHTVDTSGNINQTWRNATASTLPLSDAIPPSVTDPAASHEIPDDTDNESMWGETAQLNVTVTDDSGIARVTVNLSEIGGPAAKQMINLGGNIWSITSNASAGTPPKIYNLTVNATDIFGNSNTSAVIPLRVMKNGDSTGNGAVNIGDALRCANNVSFPGNPAYALSSPYVADVTGNGVINIGDCLRLANNVSFPWNPLYILK